MYQGGLRVCIYSSQAITQQVISLISSHSIKEEDLTSEIPVLTGNNETLHTLLFDI